MQPRCELLLRHFQLLSQGTDIGDAASAGELRLGEYGPLVIGRIPW
jgi:hypothetical protein